ncbi:Dehydrogenase OS=Streptomyces microflavus OX=1919 GN=Smic_20780 PE=3 SV=1 [Streptomyces microflavus]
MPIDARAALAAEPRRAEIAWNHKDVQLYHLGLGAGTPATDELRYTWESRLQVLPAFATVAGRGNGRVGGMGAPGIDVDLAAVLHGGQTMLPWLIPVTGRAWRRPRRSRRCTTRARPPR